MAAEGLQWVAESWEEVGTSFDFVLGVFDATGVLTRDRLEERMGLFL